MSTAQQESILIPSMISLPSFQPRTATYALGGLILSVAGLTGTYIIDERLGASVSSTAGLVVVVPIMTLATAFGAWRHGILSEWWSYSET